MSEIKVYYEESIIYQKQSNMVSLTQNYDLFNASNSYVIFRMVKYYFHSIKFHDKYMYIINKDATSAKMFIFQIELTSTETSNLNENIDKDEYKNFFTSIDSTVNKTKKISLNLRGLITDIIKDKENVKLQSVSDKKMWMVNAGKKLIVTKDIKTPVIGDDIKVSKFNESIEDNDLVNKNILLIETKPSSILQNCVRKGYYGDKVDSSTIQDSSGKIAETKKALSITALILFFFSGFGIIIFHLFTKSVDTDFFGYRLPESVFQPIAQAQAVMSGGGKMSGGSCTIPDLGSFEFRLPTPNILGYFKMSSFLLFLNMMIFGGNPVRERNLIHDPPPKRTVEEHTNDRQAFIGVGITIMVIAFGIILWYKNQQRSIFDGINPISLLLYSPDTIAIYPAVMAYLVFYTNFIKLAENKVELPEFMLFMWSFIVLSGYAMYASYKQVNSFRSGSFIAMMVVLVIIVLSIGPVMIKDLETQKKKEEGNT
jgi:hypothetical protein